MKKALIDKRFDLVVQIIDEASGEKEFETTSDFRWVVCHDKVETGWEYNDQDGFVDVHADHRDEFGNPVEPFYMQRMRAYPPMGDQMDMLWKEIQRTGTISTSGEWFKSIEFVKNNVPKPGSLGDPEPEFPEN